jgi:23S rRNA pseudouridine1911/1915/1917 synthase
MIKILFEDNHIIVAVKPYGLLSQADITGDKDILTELKKYLKMSYINHQYLSYSVSLL